MSAYACQISKIALHTKRFENDRVLVAYTSGLPPFDLDACHIVTVQMLKAEMGARAGAQAVSDDPEGCTADYSQLVEAGRRAVRHSFARAGVCEDLQSHIVHEFIIDPAQWKQRWVFACWEAQE